MIYLNVRGLSVLLGKFIERDLKSNGNLGVSLRKHISSAASFASVWDALGAAASFIFNAQLGMPSGKTAGKRRRS